MSQNLAWILCRNIVTTNQTSLHLLRTHACRFAALPLVSQRRLFGGQRPKKSNVYTRTGDKGTSSLYNGERRPKYDDVFHALGTVDELNSSIGIANNYCKNANNGLEKHLVEIQCKLIEVGSNIATPRSASTETKLSHTSFDEANLELLESWIDHLDAKLPPLKHFILPSGGESAIFLHQCRSICRRAERIIVPLVENGIADDVIQRYLNRLSDFFFVAARYAAKFEGQTENFYQQRRQDKPSNLVTRELKEKDDNES